VSGAPWIESVDPPPAVPAPEAVPLRPRGRPTGAERGDRGMPRRQPTASSRLSQTALHGDSRRVTPTEIAAGSTRNGRAVYSILNSLDTILHRATRLVAPSIAFSVSPSNIC
jgi:hypothetical protein